MTRHLPTHAAGAHPGPYKAVVFDLLTGLLDSWSLWNRVAGSAADGTRWRHAYLRHTYAQGAYRPYLDLVAAAAGEAGLPPSLATELERQWSTLAPWPDVHDVLGQLHAQVPLGVVTNCSAALGASAVACVAVPLDVVITAEAVGYYKPDQRCYEAAATALALDPGDILFVAGSPFDIVGAAAVGMPVFWHNRAGLAIPAGLDVRSPYTEARDLSALLRLMGGAAPHSRARGA